MDKIFETSLLFDFYGQLLTKRQQEILDMHINSDYSLGEIAEQLDITRQGVNDNIKRARQTLLKYEENLKLVDKFSEQKKKAGDVLKLLNKLDKNSFSKNDSEILSKIKAGIIEIVNDI